MAEEPTSTLTKKYVSAANRPPSKPTKATSTASALQSKLIARLGHLLTGTCAVVAATLSSGNLGLTQLMENQAQTLFFQLRGPVIPPEDIVILAIDEQSISVPEQYYKTEPQKYAYLEPLQRFPFKRAAYAQIIEKLMNAGARSVALDIVFDTSSLYGAEDDRRLQEVLQRYAGRITLAAVYDDSQIRQGEISKVLEPQSLFMTKPVSVGLANFPKDVNGKIHRLAGEFRNFLAKTGDISAVNMLTFDEAVLQAAQVNYPRPKGDRINFYGPAGIFESIPFWHVIDPENWNTYLQKGKVFKDKIVLIGATAKLGKDYFPVAVSNSWLYPEEMSGVEIHAHAIATLMEGKAIAQAIPFAPLRGLFVLGLVGGSAVIATKRSKRGINRFTISIVIATIGGGISYLSFFYSQLIFPTAIPVVAIIASGLCYLGTDIVREKLRKGQLLEIFQKYSSHRVIQEILSQQDDLKDLLAQREIEISGKILDGRYKIVKVLGSGGFSETYIAEDTKRPGNPLCVVKQLRPANNQSEHLEVARRLFHSEAQTLEKLGTHNQIPQLLAYFEEEEEFYLVQEYIIGHPLSQELPKQKQIQETAVIYLLRDLLQTLEFVHKNGVIHRDIKPSNIMRRDSDGKLVLIDFGAVKELTTQQLDNQEQTAFTIGIGTKGYAPTEQCFGRPQYSSDIYAVGMIGIKALTGIAPQDLHRDSYGELKWIEKAQVSPALTKILSKMVLDDFKQRYQSASEVLKALNELVIYPDKNPLSQDNLSISTIAVEDLDNPTTPWVSEKKPQATNSTRFLPGPFSSRRASPYEEFKRKN